MLILAVRWPKVTLLDRSVTCSGSADWYSDHLHTLKISRILEIFYFENEFDPDCFYLISLAYSALHNQKFSWISLNICEWPQLKNFEQPLNDPKYSFDSSPGTRFWMGEIILKQFMVSVFLFWSLIFYLNQWAERVIHETEFI